MRPVDGQIIHRTRGDEVVGPYTTVARCVKGELTPEAWLERRAVLGISGLRLVPAGLPVPLSA
jgi:hypothetical protein